MEMYIYAGSLLRQVASTRTSTIRTIKLDGSDDNPKFRNITYALLTETLKRLPLLNRLYDTANLSTISSADAYVIKVMMYDLLFGKGLKCVHTAATTLLSFEQEFRRLLTELEEDPELRPIIQARTNSSRQSVRFTRINTLRCSIQEVLNLLQGELQFHPVSTPHSFISEKEQLVESYNLQKRKRNESYEPETIPADKLFCLDSHLSDILIFPTCVNLHGLPLLKEGVLIKQDKASAFAVHALNPQPGWDVIDCCAAPGFKTLHLASLMNNEGKIFAFDRDLQRAEILKSKLQQECCKIAEVVASDFLLVDPQDSKFDNVFGILLDPSCSGSGTEFYHDHSQTPQKFAESQLALLLRCLKFRNVQRVVYSTCSINQEENEDVVQRALTQQTPAEGNPPFELLEAIPSWKRRGFSTFLTSERCLRTHPSDGLMGFFVACFQRCAQTQHY